MPIFLVTVIFRTFLLYVLYEPIALEYAVRGYVSDFVQCVPFILLYRYSGNTASRQLVFMVYSLLLAANAEHILVNKGNLLYSFAGYLQDSEFLSGSVLSSRLIILFAVSFFLLNLISFSRSRLNLQFLARLRPYFRVRGSLLFLCAVTAVYLMPVTIFNPAWQQQSLLEQNLAVFLNHLKTDSKQYTSHSIYTDIGDIKRINAQYDALNPLEMDRGQSLLNASRPEQNILLILVEGLSQHHMTNSTLKHLKTLGEENFSASHFINTQRQTNRGLYAILCAKYPNLISKMSKSDIIGTMGADTLCLPEILRKKGYETIFLQSAGLSFMRKDLFAKEVGFDQIYGNPKWIEPRLTSAWGMDDFSLYDSAVYKIQELNRDQKKWFMTLLTVSTHHPYTVPEQDGKISFEQALSFADEALYFFINTLKENNLLEDILVIITSDESNGTGDIGLGTHRGENSNFLSDNHGPFVALGRRIPAKTVQHQVFSQVDIPVTILDYLEITDLTPVGGRSLFRHYDEPKKVFFGNVYRNLFGYFKGTEEMVLCNEQLNCSEVLLSPDSFSSNAFTSIKQSDLSPAKLQKISHAVDINDLYASNFKGVSIFSETEKNYKGKRFYGLLSKYKIAGDRNVPIRLNFKIDNTVSENSNELTLILAMGSHETFNTVKNEFTIGSGELKSFSQSIFFDQDEYYWLDIYVKAKDETEWRADLIEIQL